MATVDVVVLGHGKVDKQPELAIVTVLLRCADEDLVAASAAVSAAVQNIQAVIRVLASPQSASNRTSPTVAEAAVKDWSSGSMSTRSYFQNENSLRFGHGGLFSAPQPPLPGQHEATTRKTIHEASVTISATFRDFLKLGEFTSSVVKMPLASVHDVRWTLSDETLQQLREDATTKAYADALCKATWYARAMGKEFVRPRKISELQANLMSSTGLFGVAAGNRVGGASGGNGEETTLQYVPKNVLVEASCEVHFEVTGVGCG